MNNTGLVLRTTPAILILAAVAISLHAFPQAICGTGGTGATGGLGGIAGKGGTNSEGIAGHGGSSTSGANGTNRNGTSICTNLS
ncbi:MAG: hypothetical protein WAZ77_05115 [Candidatus Nitrosopolaris sp.]